jgi:hypothetical protein
VDYRQVLLEAPFLIPEMFLRLAVIKEMVLRKQACAEP